MQKQEKPKRKRIRTREEIEYIMEYNKKTVVQKLVWFHNRLDMDIVAWLDRHRNFQGAVKDLIRQDMMRKGR